jgi:hypothetical protein
MTAAFRPFAVRPIRPLAPLQSGRFELKRYWIDLQAAAVPHDADWVGAIGLALAALPQAPDAGCPGVGFLILHRGRGADYVVLGWWARENELPLRVFVRYPGTDDDRWRPARGDESVCVWDLQVITHEREAYVATLMSGADPATMRRRYLEDVLDLPA